MTCRRWAWWTSLLVFVASCIAVTANSRIHAFYYMWYGSPEVDGRYLHWDHEVLPHWNAQLAPSFPHGMRFQAPKCVHSPFYPFRGPYSSRSRQTIQQHIDEMAEAGVGVMVLSWWGPKWRAFTHDTQGVHTDDVVAEVLSVAEGDGRVKVAFHLEPYDGRTALTVREDIADLMKRFHASPALYKINGRPVYYVYDSYRIAPVEWGTVLRPEGAATVRGTTLDGFFFALWLNAGDGDQHVLPGGFDGFYSYFASEAVSYASQPANWAELARWGRLHQRPFSASVGPGYRDDRIRPWNAAATRERADGSRYRSQWRSALDARADFVSITSYNEWGEGTQIEPARDGNDGPAAVKAGVAASEDGAAPPAPTQLASTAVVANCTFEGYGDGGPYLYLQLTRELAQQLSEPDTDMMMDGTLPLTQQEELQVLDDEL